MLLQCVCNCGKLWKTGAFLKNDAIKRPGVVGLSERRRPYFDSSVGIGGFSPSHRANMITGGSEKINNIRPACLVSLLQNIPGALRHGISVVACGGRVAIAVTF